MFINYVRWQNELEFEKIRNCFVFKNCKSIWITNDWKYNKISHVSNSFRNLKFKLYT